MEFKRKLETLLLSAGLAFGVLGFAGKTKADWSSFQVTGPSIRVPGFAENPSPTVGEFSYVNPDGNFALTTIWPFPPHISSWSLNSETGQWEGPTNLDIPGDNSAGYLSPDGNKLYYASQGPQMGDIFRARKTAEGWVSEGVIPNVNTSNADHHPCFNGQQLYFQWLYNDIYVSDYNSQTDEFSVSRPVSAVNTSEWREQAPWVSSDGKLMIFDSNRPGGYGGFDLWYATRDNPLEDSWANITNLGPYVNTSGNEGAGKIAENAKLLYFMSEGIRSQAPIVPEPSTISLIVVGLVGLLSRKKREVKLNNNKT